MSLFIALEGIDGAGKTTQIHILAQRLQEWGCSSPLVLHEPGGTPLGERLAQLLKHDLETQLTPEAELLLFGAARAQLVQEVIRPALAEGKIVLCDRYVGSTLAYQGFGRGLELARIWEVNQLATGGLLPDLTLLLDVPVEEGLRRKGKQSNLLQLDLFDPSPFDRFHDETLSFHQRIRQGYLKLATPSNDPYHAGTWVRIDGTKKVEEVADMIWAAVAPLLEAP